MKRAILMRFIGILLLALAISSAISYYFVGKKMLENNITNMIDTIQVVDYSLNNADDLQGELRRLHKNTLADNARITIIGIDGTVIADTTKDIGTLENHNFRKEVLIARRDGIGYSTRYSDTLKENMLYVAFMSKSSDYVIRMAVPYTGIFDYMKILFPMLLLGVSIAGLIAIVIAVRFAGTITQPLNEISMELIKVNGNNLDVNFKQYQYEELNIISDSTTKLYQEVREHLEKIEFEKKVRQEFFSNASHELKTPITSIKGYAELLDQGFVKDEATRRDFIERILKETDNMTNLINDILMISRLETKEAHVTLSMVCINPLVDEIFESLEPIAAEYQIYLEKECESITIEMGAKQLRELLMNLIYNGIMYNHPGGKVEVCIFQEKENLVIKVSDDGMGISPEVQERVFQRFYRVDKGRSKKMGGTGLGLSIVKHIVEFYNGSITLDSQIGKGSTFLVCIPLKRG